MNDPTPPNTTRRLAPWWILGAAAIGAGLLLFWHMDPARLGLPLCSFYAATGWHCPGCGATRATYQLLHGHVGLALQDNALWILTLPLALYMAASEVRYATAGRPLPGNLARRPALWVGLGVAAFVFFVLRSIPMYPFVLLVPPV